MAQWEIRQLFKQIRHEIFRVRRELGASDCLLRRVGGVHLSPRPLRT